MCAASRALLFARRDALDALIETTERDSTESGEVAAVRFWRVTRDVAFDLPCALFLTAYALLVPLTTAAIMAIFELPNLPLVWARAGPWGGDTTEFHAPDAGMTQTQLRVFKLQLYVFALIVGGAAVRT